MPVHKANLLIVEDDVVARELLSMILAKSGYRVRSAEDGFSALAEIRSEMPDILLSDLNMPGMSGFELLSVVRRSYPVIHVIAMSGAFSGDGIPAGVAADAFYEKGTDLHSLLQTVQVMIGAERQRRQEPGSPTPIWIPMPGYDSGGDLFVLIACPVCLRAFPSLLSEAICLIQRTDCVYCLSLIHFAIVQPAPGYASIQRKDNYGAFAPHDIPHKVHEELSKEMKAV